MDDEWIFPNGIDGRTGELLGEPIDGFGAAELGAEARVHGLIAFLFACYGAGTPLRDEFLHAPGTSTRGGGAIRRRACASRR